jgi:hypothetical protein
MSEQATVSFSYTEGEITVTDSHVITVDQIPASLALSGAGTVREGGNNLQVSAIVTYTDEKTADVTAANWSSNNAAASVDGTGLVTSSADVSADTTVVITCEYTEGGVSASNTINIIVLANVAPVSAEILGPMTIIEGDAGSYTLAVTFDDGSVSNREASDWASDNAALSIDPVSGNCTTSDITSDTNVNISASFTDEGVTVTGNLVVSVEAILPESLLITGVTTVASNETISLVATVTYSNDTTSVVTIPASWASSSSAATVNGNGVVTGGDVEVDTEVTITSNYTADGITVTDTHVINVTATAVESAGGPIIFVAGFAGPLGDAKGDSSWQQFIDNRATAMDVRPTMNVPYDFSTSTPGTDDFVYLMWPQAKGGASVASYQVIKDMDSGFAGGMDGQHWPGPEEESDNYDPVSLNYNGEDWWMIRIDYPGQGTKQWQITNFPDVA